MNMSGDFSLPHMAVDFVSQSFVGSNLHVDSKFSVVLLYQKSMESSGQ